MGSLSKRGVSKWPWPLKRYAETVSNGLENSLERGSVRLGVPLSDCLDAVPPIASENIAADVSLHRLSRRCKY